MNGDAVEFDDLLRPFREDSDEATILIEIWGLRLEGGDASVNSTTQLRTLHREDLDSFFENPQVDAYGAGISTQPYDGAAFLQLSARKASEDQDFFLHRPYAYQEPWLSYINLFNSRTVSAGDRFFKWDSMRRFPPVIGERQRTAMVPSIFEVPGGAARSVPALIIRAGACRDGRCPNQLLLAAEA